MIKSLLIIESNHFTTLLLTYGFLSIIWRHALLFSGSIIQKFFIYTFTPIIKNSSLRSDSGGFSILLHVNVFSVFRNNKYIISSISVTIYNACLLYTSPSPRDGL